MGRVVRGFVGGGRKRGRHIRGIRGRVASRVEGRIGRRKVGGRGRRIMCRRVRWCERWLVGGRRERSRVIRRAVRRLVRRMESRSARRSGARCRSRSCRRAAEVALATTPGAASVFVLFPDSVPLLVARDRIRPGALAPILVANGPARALGDLHVVIVVKSVVVRVDIGVDIVVQNGIKNGVGLHCVGLHW